MYILAICHPADGFFYALKTFLLDRSGIRFIFKDVIFIHTEVYEFTNAKRKGRQSKKSIQYHFI